jgi:hypothetical protein
MHNTFDKKYLIIIWVSSMMPVALLYLPIGTEDLRPATTRQAETPNYQFALIIYILVSSAQLAK